MGREKPVNGAIKFDSIRWNCREIFLARINDPIGSLSRPPRLGGEEGGLKHLLVR